MMPIYLFLPETHKLNIIQFLLHTLDFVLIKHRFLGWLFWNTANHQKYVRVNNIIKFILSSTNNRALILSNGTQAYTNAFIRWPLFKLNIWIVCYCTTFLFNNMTSQEPFPSFPHIWNKCIDYRILFSRNWTNSIFCLFKFATNKY